MALRDRHGGVLGGAIGNLIDRVRYGEVIDFLDFRPIGGYVWPTFNMADCWIVVGVGILMLEMFFEPRPRPRPSRSSRSPAPRASSSRAAGSRGFPPAAGSPGEHAQDVVTEDLADLPVAQVPRRSAPG